MSSSRSPDYRHMQRRDSSSSMKRRPKLLRACATEPSITPSNASRGVLANPQPSQRATDILNRMAFSGGSSPDSLYRGSSPPSGDSPIYEQMQRMSAADVLCSSPTSHSEALDDLCARPRAFYLTHRGDSYDDLTPSSLGSSDRYFSFPSFDTWEPECPDGEKDRGAVKSTG